MQQMNIIAQYYLSHLQNTPILWLLRQQEMFFHMR